MPHYEFPTPATEWQQPHSWGDTNPETVVTTIGGRRMRTGVTYEPGLVRVRFSTPTAGRLDLHDPTGVGLADITSPAQIRPRPPGGAR